ncbi:MAG: hypothetical protein HLUCCX10_11995 [Algoriphagus marincola HL-49]|uniref:6-bladed beta-propeller n=1 Tax=Algoriphagus marincola HL-49 TaxID=1305737 RepID=A0A0P8BV12_9BACT|nr:MAG: hypothetical protein HLUCCX10_11995 [Algoriphagus marincola HL-49]
MNTKLFISILFFCLIFSSCDRDQESHSEVIQINLNDAKKSVALSSFLKNPNFILLKDSEQIPLVSPYQFQFKNNKIFVRDLDYNNIHIYSRNGEFLEAILSSGEGPKEFIQINDFFVTENEVIIQDTYLRKIIKFDHGGNFLSERPHLINNSRFAFSADKFLYYMANDPEFDGKNYIIEKDEKITAKLLQIEPELENSGKFLQSNSFLELGENQFLLYRPYTYQINYLDLESNKLKQSISFDFGEAQLTPSQHRMSTNLKNQLVSERNLVAQFISVLPTTNGTIISFLRGNKQRFYLHLSPNQNLHSLISEPENDMIPITLNSPWTTDGERIYYILNSIDFYNQYAKHFAEQNVSIEDGNIHDFFQKNKNQLIEDRTLLISFQVKDTF